MDLHLYPKDGVRPDIKKLQPTLEELGIGQDRVTVLGNCGGGAIIISGITAFENQRLIDTIHQTNNGLAKGGVADERTSEQVGDQPVELRRTHDRRTKAVVWPPESL